MKWTWKKQRSSNWYEIEHTWFAWHPVVIYTTDDVERDTVVWWEWVNRSGTYLYDSQGGSITWNYILIDD